MHIIADSSHSATLTQLIHYQIVYLEGRWQCVNFHYGTHVNIVETVFISFQSHENRFRYLEWLINFTLNSTLWLQKRERVCSYWYYSFQLYRVLSIFYKRFLGCSMCENNQLQCYIICWRKKLENCFSIIIIFVTLLV